MYIVLMYLIKAYYVFDTRTAKADYVRTSTPHGKVEQETAEEPDWIVSICSINTFR